MSVIFVALPVALLMGAVAAWACARCILAGQFDDLQSPPVRMLLDETPSAKSPGSDAETTSACEPRK
jgi:cbb3-type cytochrome oxidase maturation protein